MFSLSINSFHRENINVTRCGEILRDDRLSSQIPRSDSVSCNLDLNEHSLSRSLASFFQHILPGYIKKSDRLYKLQKLSTRQ